MRVEIFILLFATIAAIAFADDEQDYKDFIKKYRNNKDNSTR